MPLMAAHVFAQANLGLNDQVDLSGDTRRSLVNAMVSGKTATAASIAIALNAAGGRSSVVRTLPNNHRFADCRVSALTGTICMQLTTRSEHQMITTRKRLWAVALSGWMAVALVFPSISFAQSVGGRRNTTLGLLGGTVYHAVKGHKGEAVVFGLGTAYAWTRYEKARKAEKQRKAAGAIHSYSATRSGSGGRSSGAPAGAGGNGGYAGAGGSGHSNSVNGRLARLEEQSAIRQQSMQQNLDELSVQAKDLDKRNAELGAQLKKSRVEAANNQRGKSWNLDWALIATALALALGGGLLYTMLKQRERFAPRRAAAI